jgi:DNA-binding response OmpR family regulator
MTRILVVEDDSDIADLIARALRKGGYEVEVRSNGREALRSIAEHPPGVVVLDLMLPQLNGLELCRMLRADEQTASIPVIMVTARSDEAERIAGLDIGADDYLGKPFSPGELVARVRAVLRRSSRAPAAPSTTIEYGPLTVDVSRHTVTDRDRPATLTAKEFLLLEYLLRHRGHVLSRDRLLTDVWGYRYTGGTRTVDVHVRRLREKLPLLSEALVTVKQFGYRLLDDPPQAAAPAHGTTARQRP